MGLAENMTFDPSKNIRRSMWILGTSTTENPKTLRLLYYGQSISEQDWHLEVTDYLETTFPHADIVMENRARGGCASQCLIDYVDDDVYPFNPDLVIFHVYGDHLKYEEIVSMMRNHVNPNGLKPEVLLWNDHYTGPDSWSDFMSWDWMPDKATQYKCGFVDVRTPWIDTVNTNCGGDPSCYLIDDVHLNAAGNALLASLIEPYLIYDPNLPPTKMTNPKPVGYITDVSINANLGWTPGVDATSHDVYFGTTFSVPFVANVTDDEFDPGTLNPNTIYYWRVDAVNNNGTTPGALRLFTTGTGAGTGLKAEYYDNSDLTNLAAVRTDPVVDFNWGPYWPHPSVDTDTFSIRWTGQVEPLYSETYTFYTLTNDGVRLWVDDTLIIDKWQNQSATEWSGTIALTAGTKYNIKMEYFDNTGDATAQLSWSSASQAKQVIPQARLYRYPLLGDLDTDYELDLRDVAVLFEQWMDTGDCSADPNCADLDDSNDVDFKDFAVMGSTWGL